MPKRTLSDDQEKRLTVAYEKGAEISMLTTEFNISQQTIYNILRRHHISLRQPSTANVSKKIIRKCQNGHTAVSVAKFFDIAPSSVVRTIRQHRVKGKTVRLKRGRPSIIVRVSAPRAEHSFDETVVETIYRDLRKLEFPLPPKLLHPTVQQEISRLKTLHLILIDDVIRPWSTAGARVCKPFFPNRYRATWRNQMSAFDAWEDETMLKKAIRFQLRHGDPTTPLRIVRALDALCRTPTIFKPSVARFVYERFCRPGGTTWDPCSGFGGRLLGAFVAGVHYIGTDVDEATVIGNNALALEISASAVVHKQRAERFASPRVDLVFTSPPYFDQERYSHNEQQSWKLHGANLQSWLRGFLVAVVERAHEALNVGGFLVLNVADIRRRNVIVPLIAKTIESVCTNGFSHTTTLRFPLARISRKTTEPLLVFTRR